MKWGDVLLVILVAYKEDTGYFMGHRHHIHDTISEEFLLWLDKNPDMKALQIEHMMR